MDHPPEHLSIYGIEVKVLKILTGTSLVLLKFGNSAYYQRFERLDFSTPQLLVGRVRTLAWSDAKTLMLSPSNFRRLCVSLRDLYPPRP